MKVSISQKSQLIILCCLLTVVIGFGAYRVVGKGTHAGPRSPEHSRAAGKSIQAEPARAGDDRSEVASVRRGGLAQLGVGEQTARDPFEPQIVPAVQGPRLLAGTPRAHTPLIAQGSNLPLPVISPLSAQSVEFGPISEPEQEDPRRALRLTGVIVGDVNVAIIRGAEGARYIVREGQSIDGKYHVQAISRTGVRLRFNGDSFILKLGSAAEG